MENIISCFNLRKLATVTLLIVGVVLISLEIYTYFVTKPTSVEFKDGIQMTSKYLPDILMCPRPAFNLKVMQQRALRVGVNV